MGYLFLALRKFFAKLSFNKAETASPASLSDKSKFENKLAPVTEPKMG